MGDHVGYRNPTQLSDGQSSIQSTIQSSYAEIDPRYEDRALTKKIWLGCFSKL